MSGAESYALWVLNPANQRETGRLIKLACQRFISDLQRTDIRFDEVQAVRMTNFGERYCYQWEGDFEGEIIKWENWQRFIFEQIYGWFYVSTDKLRFTEVFVEMAKKNGKSTMCAVLMDFHLIADDRVKTPKIYTAANNEDQAKICVNMAGRIIEASPNLAELVTDRAIALFNYKENITEVVHKEKNGFIKAFSKESSDKTLKTTGGKHGVNASLGVIDEFGMSPDHGASKPIKTSMASRKERLMFYITTAGFNMDGPCYKELRKTGIDVLDGTIVKDNYLPIIYEIDQPLGDDGKPIGITVKWLIENEWAWKQSSPNLDVSVQREALRELLQDARDHGGTTEVDVLTLNFNIWMNSAQTFIPADIWNKNTHGLTLEELEGEDCYGGIEFVSGKLMNAFSFIFPSVKGHPVIRTIFWMPEENPDRVDLYDKWVKDGFITTFLGNVCDNDKIVDLLMTEIVKYNMHSFAYKNTLENSDIVQALIKQEILGYPISHGYQGIGTPTLMWEEMITSGQCEHFANPVMAWNNGNCLAQRKENDLRLVKQGSTVVGIYAAINAVAQWKTIEAEEQEEESGVDIL